MECSEDAAWCTLSLTPPLGGGGDGQGVEGGGAGHGTQRPTGIGDPGIRWELGGVVIICREMTKNFEGNDLDAALFKGQLQRKKALQPVSCLYCLMLTCLLTVLVIVT